MAHTFSRARLWAAGLALLAIAALAIFLVIPNSGSQSSNPAAPQAVPVSVALVEPRNVELWDDFSGRLEAIERVDIRSRVAGIIEAIHFREGARVAKGDLLITIDPAPYAAEVSRTEAQVTAAEAQVALAKVQLARGHQLWETRSISQQDIDQRTNAAREAEANLKAAEATAQSARLNLGYTEIRAPVDGRIGRLQVTVGNLVAAGSNGPVLTTLVSIDPIYASFDADEGAVARALGSISEPDALAHLERIPVDMITATGDGKPVHGRLQLIDNQISASTGTVRLRARFDNGDGRLIPGQFARLRLGRAAPKPLLMISERAIGTDQDKRYVMVVGADDKAAYRQVDLGPSAQGLRVVNSGLKAGERIIVNGLQHVRPGALVKPEPVPMLAENTSQPGNGG